MRRDPRPGDAPVLDGEAVPAINCRLRGAVERADPVVLVENADMSFLGSKIYGQGFTLTPAERDELVRKNKKNGERIFPYIGGEEVNTSPTQDYCPCPEYRPLTKFEQRGIRLGHGVWDLIFTKT